MIDLIKDLNKQIEEKIDRSEWRKWKFSDLVENINEKVVPKDSGLEHYIGLEHLDSGTLHIKRFGETSSLIGEKLKIYKDDIIFAKRNAYLKRVAIADFDAVASAHSLVLRAKPKNIVPSFLAFFLLSDAFWKKAIEISVGSLSPTINWPVIARQEFKLPPKDQQDNLSKLFLIIDELIEQDLILLNKLSLHLQSHSEKMLHGLDLKGKTIRQAIDILGKTSKVESLRNLGKFLKGKGISKSEVIEIGMPCVRYGELYTTHHKHIRDYHSFVSEITARDALELQKHDVLFASSGETISEIGKSAAFVKDDLCFAGSDILVFRPNNMDGTYLGYLMNSNFVRQQLNKLGTGATVMHVYASDLEKIKIPVISRDLQEKIGQELELIQSNIAQLNIKIQSTRLLQKSLINLIF